MGQYATINGLARLVAAGLVFVSTAATAGERLEALWDGYRATTEITLPFAGVAGVAAVRIEASYIAASETSVGALTRLVTAEQPRVSDTVLLDHDPRLMQIETCRRQGLAICPILNVRGSGSGFIDNGRRLFTCRHVVGDWPLAAALLNGRPVADIVPPMVVRDQAGGLIYNSAHSDNEIRFETINDDPRLENERMLLYRALASRPLPQHTGSYSETLQYLIKASDFVSMASRDDLIDPVPLAHDGEVEIGDRMYLSGYPVRTDLPPRFEGDTGQKLVSSVLTARLYSSRLPMVMADGLQRPGGSGGMVTNADGEVIGMSCFADRGMAYAFWLDTEAQRNFWQTLRSNEYADVLGEAEPALAIAAK